MRPDKLISITIAEQSLDFMEVIRKKGKNILLSYGSYDFNMDNIDEFDEILSIISQSIKKPYYAGISLIHRDILRLTVTLNKTTDLKTLILQNLKKTFEIKLSEYYLDYNTYDLSDNKVVVFATAVNRKLVDPLFKIFKKHNFKLLFMEPGIISSLRAITYDLEQDALLHLHLDYQRATITIVENGVIHAIRYINLGFEDMVAWLAEAGGVSNDDAEEIFYNQGLKEVDEDDELKQNIRQHIIDIIDKLSLEIQRTIDYYSMTYKKPSVKNFVISGVCKNIPSFNSYLSKLFSVVVSFENSEKYITVQSEENPDFSNLKFPFVCIGGALR